MSKSNAQADSSAASSRRKSTRGETPAARSRRLVEASSLYSYLRNLGLPVDPTIHINGHVFTTAIVTVDFGAPLDPIKLTSDENAEVTEHLRALTKTVLGRETNVHIETDTKNGLVYWSKLS